MSEKVDQRSLPRQEKQIQYSILHDTDKGRQRKKWKKNIIEYYAYK